MSSANRSGGVVSPLRTVFGVPFRFQTYRNLLYLLLAFPLGMAYFVFLTVGISLGVSLAVVVVGIPILLAVLAISTGLATVEREITVLLLGVEIPSPASETPDSWRDRVVGLVTDLGTWKALAYLGSKFVLGLVSFVVVITLLVTAVSLLAVPFVYDQPGVYVGIVTDAPVSFHPSLYVAWRHLLVGIEAVVEIGAWQVTTLSEALWVAAFGVLLGIGSLHLLNGLARFSAWYTRLLLGGKSEDADETPETPSAA